MKTIKINSSVSEPFELHNGTQQGCPLYPLIFILTLEPLIIHIRDNPNIKGISMKLREQKVAGYTNDLLFFITQPLTSLPSILAEFQKYSTLFNFKINIQMSESMNLNLPRLTLDTLWTHFQFQWSSKYIKYLGIFLAPDVDGIFTVSFPLLLVQI